MPEKLIQDFLFQRIREALPGSHSLVDTVAEALHISANSAYRRIRGETPLVLEETRLLCEKFNVSLDQLLTLTGNPVVFETQNFGHGGGDFKSYLQHVLYGIRQLAASQDNGLIFVTSDIPFFQQFHFLPLITFRYFAWTRSAYHHPRLQQQKFSLDCLPSDIEALGKEIQAVYNSIPSTEVLSTECVSSVLLQISHYHQSGMMTKAEAREVVGGLRQAIRHLQREAEYGCKFLPGENPRMKKDNYQLYCNRVGLGDHMILTLHDGQKTLYLNYEAVDYLLATDKAFCNKVHLQLQTHMRQSTLISSVSERQRNIFFNSLYGKLPRFENSGAKLTQ